MYISWPTARVSTGYFNQNQELVLFSLLHVHQSPPQLYRFAGGLYFSYMLLSGNCLAL